MRKAISFIIVLIGLSHFFQQTFNELDKAGAQSLKTLQAAAIVTEDRLMK